LHSFFDCKYFNGLLSGVLMLTQHLHDLNSWREGGREREMERKKGGRGERNKKYQNQ
jgi:hypothetical protein